MSTAPQNKKTLPFSPTLMAIDTVALLLVALSLAELFSKNDAPLGFIPEQWIWPILVGSGLVAAICSFRQFKIVCARQQSKSGIEKL